MVTDFMMILFSLQDIWFCSQALIKFELTNLLLITWDLRSKLKADIVLIDGQETQTNRLPTHWAESIKTQS